MEKPGAVMNSAAVGLGDGKIVGCHGSLIVAAGFTRHAEVFVNRDFRVIDIWGAPMHFFAGFLDLLGSDFCGRECGGGVLRGVLADAFAQEVVGQGEVATKSWLHPALQLNCPIVGILRFGISMQLAE